MLTQSDPKILKSEGVTAEEAGCDAYKGCWYNTSILQVAESENGARQFYWSGVFY
jgi:hypothetical protein